MARLFVIAVVLSLSCAKAEAKRGFRQCTLPVMIAPDIDMQPQALVVLKMAIEYWNNVGPTKMFFLLEPLDVVKVPRVQRGGVAIVAAIDQEDIATITDKPEAIGAVLFRSKTTTKQYGKCYGPTDVILADTALSSEPGYALTLVIHELGHALGLEHSPNELSVMYDNMYSPTGQWPKLATADDLEALRELYAVEHQ